MRITFSLAAFTWLAFAVGVILAFFLLAPLTLAQGADPAPVDVAQTVANVIAGLVAPFLVQWLKTVKKWSGPLAFVVTLVACYALAAIALLFTGGIAGAEDLFTNGSQVAIVALALYRLFFKPFIVGEDPVPVPPPSGG